MVKKRYLLLCLVFLLVACGSTFPYKWYGLDLPDYSEGKLLGPKPKDDLPISRCAPDEVQKGKCVVIFVDEWDRLRNDHIELRVRLDACEKKR